MSYERMVRAEGEPAAEVDALLADAERLDAAEDTAYGTDRRGNELPAELARREGRLLTPTTRRLEQSHVLAHPEFWSRGCTRAVLLLPPFQVRTSELDDNLERVALPLAHHSQGFRDVFKPKLVSYEFFPS